MKADLQIGFLTGQSNPLSCALSPAQHAFLRQVGTPETELLQLNFPYHEGPEFTRIPLWRASINNLRHYLRSRSHAQQAGHRSNLIRLINQANRTLFLAGSCGLELFANLSLPAEVAQRCTLLAYGPVARRLPQDSRVVIAQGTGDFLSRLFIKRCDHSVECSHLNYLSTPSFVKLCRDVVQQELNQLSCNSTSA